jgi:hypothetical protein
MRIWKEKKKRKYALCAFRKNAPICALKRKKKQNMRKFAQNMRRYAHLEIICTKYAHLKGKEEEKKNDMRISKLVCADMRKICACIKYAQNMRIKKTRNAHFKIVCAFRNMHQYAPICASR